MIFSQVRVTRRLLGGSSLQQIFILKASLIQMGQFSCPLTGSSGYTGTVNLNTWPLCRKLAAKLKHFNGSRKYYYNSFKLLFFSVSNDIFFQLTFSLLLSTVNLKEESIIVSSAAGSN